MEVLDAFGQDHFQFGHHAYQFHVALSIGFEGQGIGGRSVRSNRLIRIDACHRETDFVRGSQIVCRCQFADILHESVHFGLGRNRTQCRLDSRHIGDKVEVTLPRGHFRCKGVGALSASDRRGDVLGNLCARS